MSSSHSSAIGIIFFFSVVASTLVHVSSSQQLMLKGSVSCLDCTPQHDLSGVRLGVKCNNLEKTEYAVTNKHGLFESILPTISSPPFSPPAHCQATILGGTTQLCARRNTMVSSIVVKMRATGGSYGLSSPLSFFMQCQSRTHQPAVADEKAPASHSPPTPVGFPPPVNMGGLPLIFLFPFFPIIGIP